MFPHGGPHSSSNTKFSPTITSFCALGFKCLLVNYSGSTGFGNDSIKYSFHSHSSLIGHIGTLDVEDTHAAAKWAAALDDLMKDLHGFITAHLLAREHRGFYAGGCLRNPVTHIGAMVSDTDIPD